MLLSLWLFNLQLNNTICHIPEYPNHTDHQENLKSKKIWEWSVSNPFQIKRIQTDIMAYHIQVY